MDPVNTIKAAIDKRNQDCCMGSQESIESELQGRTRKLLQEYNMVSRGLSIISQGKEVSALETLELGSILQQLNIRPR